MTASAVKALVQGGMSADAVIREVGTVRWHLISKVKGLAAVPSESAPTIDWRTTPLVRVSSSYANFVSDRIDELIGLRFLSVAGEYRAHTASASAQEIPPHFGE